MLLRFLVHIRDFCNQTYDLAKEGDISDKVFSFHSIYCIEALLIHFEIRNRKLPDVEETTGRTIASDVNEIERRKRSKTARFCVGTEIEIGEVFI